MIISPLSGKSMPLSKLSKVDFPEPLRPSNTIISPRCIRKSSDCNTLRVCSPSRNDLESLFIWISDCALLIKLAFFEIQQRIYEQPLQLSQDFE